MKCNKKKYLTISEARKILINEWLNNNKTIIKPNRAYLCEICGNYHITSNTKKRQDINIYDTDIITNNLGEIHRDFIKLEREFKLKYNG